MNSYPMWVSGSPKKSDESLESAQRDPKISGPDGLLACG